MAEAALSFERVSATREVETISRPSLSYWQDAWVRLKANTRALISLYIVIALGVFTLAGPRVWSVDPSAQDLDQISAAPGTDRAAVIVPPYQPWSGATVRVEGPALSAAAIAASAAGICESPEL